MRQVYWHWPTFIMFIALGLLFMWANIASKKRALIKKRALSVFSPEYNLVFIVWLFVGVFRLIDIYHGGTDAPSYIYSFLHESLKSGYVDNTDKAFAYYNICLRHITSNYHIFFAVTYFIFVYSFIKIVNSLSLSWSSSVPLFMTSYLYYVGFSSLRSNLAFSLFLIAIAFYVERKYTYTLIFSVLACTTHVSLAMYVPALIFCHLFWHMRIKKWHVIVAMIISQAFGILLQNSFLSGSFSFLENIGSGAYAAYAAKSLESTFDAYLLINLPCIGIGTALFIFWNKIDNLINNSSVENSAKIKVLKLICLYDVLLIPITYMLGVYRGYMYLMMTRLLMWGIIIFIVQKELRFNKIIVSIFSFIVFLFWIWSRYRAMYESSQLMPYVLDFL